LCEAKNDLVGFALFDRLEQPAQDRNSLKEYQWQRREIENYLCQPETLLAYAGVSAAEAIPGALWEAPERERRRSAMQSAINDSAPPAALRNPSDVWWVNMKASDEFLDRVFAAFFANLGLPNTMPKSNYHILASCVPVQLLDEEIRQVLDIIYEVSQAARPLSDEG